MKEEQKANLDRKNRCPGLICLRNTPSSEALQFGDKMFQDLRVLAGGFVGWGQR